MVYFNVEKIKEYYNQCDRSYQHWGDEEIYNIHYGFWDKKTKSHVGSLNNMNRILAERLRIEPGDKILDAGCGVGASTIWLAKNYDVEVTGITISELQCNKANLFAKKAGVSGKVKFYLQDFNKTNFPDESFDIVWGLESICYAPDKKRFIKEMKRILKSNGKFIIADGFLKKEKPNKIDRFFLSKWFNGWVIPNLADVDEFRRFLDEYGFKNIEFKDITKNVLKSSREIFKRGILGWPVYKLRRKAPVQVNHIKGCIFQYLILRNKTWVYGFFYGES